MDRETAAVKSALKLSIGRRSVRTLELDLPKPLSVNNLFFNVPDKGRVASAAYKEWRKQAGLQIMAQRIGHIGGPVEIYIGVKEGKGDLDGTIKCLLDSLVHNGIIDGDGPKVVRRLVVEWADVPGARIGIKPSADWLARKIGLRK